MTTKATRTERVLPGASRGGLARADMAFRPSFPGAGHQVRSSPFEPFTGAGQASRVGGEQTSGEGCSNGRPTTQWSGTLSFLKCPVLEKAQDCRAPSWHNHSLGVPKSLPFPSLVRDTEIFRQK
jgi:hypothetical protein